MQQLMLKQHHDRQRGFSSSSAAAQESSSSGSGSQAEHNEEAKAHSLSTKRDIDPTEVENKRRRVRDVSLIVYKSL